MSDSEDIPPHDYTSLLKEYRGVDAARRTYAEENEKILRKQRQIIDRLEKDNQAITSELELEEKMSKRMTSQDNRTKLTEQFHEFQEKLTKEQSQVDNLKAKIATLQDDITTMKARTGGADGAVKQKRAMERQIKVLENRLEKALKKFNEVLARNKESRKKIDGLRQERLVFDRTYQKLEARLNEKKKRMAEVIQRSNEAYEKRDNAELRMQELANQTQHEQSEAIELADALEKHGNDATGSDQIQYSIHGEAGRMLDEEAEWEAKVKEIELQSESVQKEIESVKAKVQFYEDAFDKIQQATGIDDLETLMQEFHSKEQINYDLFQKVAQQNEEIESLETQLDELRTRTLQERAQGKLVAEQERTHLRPLEQRRVALEKAAGRFEEQYTDLKTKLSSICEEIHQVVKTLNCSQEEITHLSPDGGVYEANAVKFLGLIEQNAYQIIEDMIGHDSTYQSNDETNKLSPSWIRQRVSSGTNSPLFSRSSHSRGASQNGKRPTSANSMHIQAPELRDFDSDENEDEESRPLSMHELKRRTRQNLHSRGGILAE